MGATTKGSVLWTSCIYDVYRNGKLVASVNHLRANGALMLAHCAMDAALDVLDAGFRR